MKNVGGKIVATNDDRSASGIITYWALSGEMEYATLKQAWEDAGMDMRDLIQPPSGMVALQRAIKEVSPDGSIVKPLKEQDGYTVIRKVKEKGAVQKWETEFSAYISETSQLTVFVESGDHRQERELAAKIEDQVDKEIGTLHSIDVSNWLVKMADRVRAVSLREQGGFYFIPKGPYANYWEEMSKVLHQTSAVRILYIPAMHSEQASLAVVHALTEEVHASTRRMQEALDEARMGKRALDTKIQTCTGMLEKIAGYEDLLGEKLNTLREAVDGLKAKYVEAWVLEDASES